MPPKSKIEFESVRRSCVESVMDADFYVEILQTTLLPFLTEKYPEDHRFMQDDDLKHISWLAPSFFADNNIT